MESLESEADTEVPERCSLSNDQQRATPLIWKKSVSIKV